MFVDYSCKKRVVSYKQYYFASYFVWNRALKQLIHFSFRKYPINLFDELVDDENEKIIREEIKKLFL